MTTELRSALRMLADEELPASPPGDLWRRGVRRSRQRRAATALATTAAMAAAVVAGPVALDALDVADRQPFASGQAHAIPDQVRTPSPWLEATTDTGPIGPLALIGGAERKSDWGLTTHPSAVFGVSATTGQYAFLPLPGLASGDEAGSVPPTLSPDGRLVAYALAQPGHADRVGGLAVYDTVTEEVTQRPIDSELGLQPEVLTWVSAGTVLFSYAVVTERDSDGKTATSAPDLLWAPDRGAPVESDRPGGVTTKAWPVPEGFAHATRSGLVVRDTSDGARASAHEVLGRGTESDLAVDPSGRTVVALGPRPGVGGLTRTLKVGQLGDAPVRMRTLRTDVLLDPTQALGWQGPNHVVVSATDDDTFGAYAINLETGTSALLVSEDEVATSWLDPSYADLLWQSPTVSRPEPPHVTDPRLRAAGAATVVLALLAAAGWMVRRRRAQA